MSNPNFLRLIDNDEGEITIVVNGAELRGWSYASPQEQYLKMRMAREFCEGWYTGFASGLDRAQAVVSETFGKNISAGLWPSPTAVSSND